MTFLTTSPTRLVDLNSISDPINPNMLLTPEGVKLVKTDPNTHYLLAQNVIGKNELLTELVAIRKGNDLIIFDANGSQVVFTDYYLFCAFDSDIEEAIEQACSVTVAGKDGGGHTITKIEPTNGEVNTSDTSTIVYTQGKPSLLQNMMGLDSDLDAAISTYIEPEQTTSWGSAAGIIGGLMSSFGTSSASVTAESISSAVTKVYSVSAVLGPLIDGGVGTKITLYKPDGSVLGNMTYDTSSNTFIYTDSSGYSGIVIAHLQDTDEEADYRDETTGLETDITTDLYVVAAVSDTNEAVTLYITPLSSIAATELGVVKNDSNVTLVSDVVTVENTNKAVAHAFGLGSDVDLARSIVKTTIKSTGESASDANAYGKALAIISAAEQQSTDNPVSTAQVMRNIVSNLTVNGSVGTLTTAVKSDLVANAPAAGIGRGDASRILDTVDSINLAPTGSINIQGYAKQNQTLTALSDTLYDPNGIAELSFQWQANSIDIHGADNRSYTLTKTDVGKSITVEVSYTDGSGIDEIIESKSTNIVSNISGLVKIQAYAGNSDDTPNVVDYSAIGITLVDADNLNATNALVKSGTSTGTTTVAAIAVLANTANNIADTAHAKIQTYVTTGIHAPTVADYTAAGITGVDDNNLNTTNALVGLSTTALTDTVTEIQTIAMQANHAANQAMVTIQSYLTNDRARLPSVSEFTTAGILGVDADNLNATNAAIKASVSSLTNTVPKIQIIATAANTAADDALAKIQAYAKNTNGLVPNVADYAAAGIMEVDEDNLNAVNTGIGASTAEGTNTVAAIQTIATAKNSAADHAMKKIQDHVRSDPSAAPSVADYIALGILGVDEDNLNATNTDFHTSAAELKGTSAKIQVIATAANIAADQALRVIQIYMNDAESTTPIVATYATAGILGVDEDNVNATNLGIRASTSAITASIGSSLPLSMPLAPAIMLWTWLQRRAISDTASLPIDPSDPGGRPRARAALARPAVHSDARWKHTSFIISWRSTGSSILPIARARSMTKSGRPIRCGYHS